MTFLFPVDAWCKCAIDGCFVRVYGPIHTGLRCSAHGGAPAFQEASDPFGNPLDAERAVPPPPVSAQ